MNRKITSILMSFSLIFSIVPFYNVSAIVDDSKNLDDYTVAKQEVPSDYEITTVDENGNVISLETVEQNMPDTSDDLDEKIYLYNLRNNLEQEHLILVFQLLTLGQNQVAKKIQSIRKMVLIVMVILMDTMQQMQLF